jgi:hypothetical protein
MSRTAYARPRYALGRWPQLAEFLPAVIHGDDRRTVQQDLQEKIDAMPLPLRETLICEWCDWNASDGAVDDVRPAIEAFDSGMAFDTALHARAFMNKLYDRLIVSIRSVSGKDWKP